VAQEAAAVADAIDAAPVAPTAGILARAVEFRQELTRL
jgi:hypothetical protein